MVFLLIAVSCQAYGQSYYFRHYQVENGLSNNAVICSTQDSYGFLWFGTKDGLDRFDGYSFKVFRNDASVRGSIGNNFIHSLYAAPNGVLWAGTENGLYQYNANTESFALLPGTTNAPTRDIQMDVEGNLWFIWGFTLTVYNVHTHLLKSFDQNQYFEATSVCIAADGVPWVSTADGLLKKYSGGDRFVSYDLFAHSKRVVSKWIEKVYLMGTTILVGTSNQGVKSFDISVSSYQDVLTYNTDGTDLFARNFVQVSAHEFWIATETGIYIYHTLTHQATHLSKTYNNPYSISDNAVYSFCQDKEGGIWATTYFGGINYYPSQHTPFKKWFPMLGENSLSGNVVREIHQDGYGNFWIGTEDAGLNKYDTLTRTFEHFQPGASKTAISYSNIHGLLVSGDALWVGTFEHGLDVMDIRTGRVTRHYCKGDGPGELKSNFIYCITQMDSGQIILGTTRGAYLYHPGVDTFSVLPGMPLNNWYTCLLKDAGGVTWAGTYGNGLNFYNTRTGESGNFRYDAANPNSIGSDRVNSVFEDSRHILWLATEGGLCAFNPQQHSFTRYTTRQGFPSNFMLSILEDDAHALWVSTSRGLVRFYPPTAQVVVYTKMNGILNDQFNFNSAYKDAAGRMYFGSEKGLISFHPGEFSQNTFVPPVYLTDLQVFNQELAIGAKGSPLQQSITHTNRIVLAYAQSTLSIGFAALSYTAPEMLEYAYRMDGLDKDWTYLKTNRKAYFTKLPPGTYLFRVKACDNNKVWHDTETQLTIQVLPPWWATDWAYAFYVLLIGMVIAYLVYHYHQRVEEKNRRKIEQLEIAKEKEIFRAKIDFFTNVAHEIRTPLTLIKGPLEKIMRKAGSLPEIQDSVKIMDRNTNRLIDLTNQLLDFRQTEINGFRLSFVKVNVSELLEDAWLNFKPLAEEKRLQYTIHLPATSLYAYLDIDAFTKILANLFSNAIKYASHTVQVQLLSFSEKDTRFTIEVRNDGYLIPYEMKDKIFEPFFRLPETAKQKGTGIGLALSLSLVQLHKGVLGIRPSVNNLNCFYLVLPLEQDQVPPIQQIPFDETIYTTGR